MEEVTAGVCLVSISQSRYSAIYNGGHAKTVFLHAAISAAAHQTCEMLMNVNFRICRDERSELLPAPIAPAARSNKRPPNRMVRSAKTRVLADLTVLLVFLLVFYFKFSVGISILIY